LPGLAEGLHCRPTSLPGQPATRAGTASALV
jgi:hypothetical protein